MKFKLANLRLSPLRLIRCRMLRPFARHLLDRKLWKPTPHAMGVGMAIGFFFGILIPFGQIFFAVAVAVVVRANLLTAATSTLISNPLTFPPIYYLAWQTGRMILGWLPQSVQHGAEHLAGEAAQTGMLGSVGTAGAELLLGLFVIAPLCAIAGYLIGHALSRFSHHWRKPAPNGDRA